MIKSEPTPQVTEKMWAIISQICSFYTDIMDFLYWEVYYEICDFFIESLVVSIITKLSLIGVFFALGIYLLNKVDELEKGQFNRGYQHHENYDADRQSVEAKTPIAPTSPLIYPVATPLPRPDSPIPTIYSPPYEFPFEHFRGTGESFTPSRQNLHVERPRYIPPVTYKGSTFLKTTENVQRLDEGIPAVAEDAEPPHEEVEQAQLFPDTPSPPPTSNRSTSLPETASIQTPIQTPQTPHLPEPPSPRTIRVNALNRVAQEEHKIQEQIVIFLNMIPTGSGYELSATLILDLLCEAKEYLEPLFPDGLSGIPTGYLVWGQTIIDFWNALSPYGWDFVNHPDSRMPEFIRRYLNLAIWFGLEERLSEFLFVPPFIPRPESESVPIPEPIPEPIVEDVPITEPIPEATPEPLPEPVMSITEARPQFQEQMRVAPVSSSATSPPPQPEHSAPQPDSAPATYTYTMSTVPTNFSYQKPSQKSDPLPNPSSTLPADDAAPAIPVQETVQPPQKEQSTMITSFSPLNFTYIPSNPVNPSHRRSNRTSKPPLTKPSRPSQAPQKQPAEPPKPTPVDPNLLDFTDPKWSNKLTPELLTLTWSSFSFPTPSAAALKLWSHSTMGRLSLPEPRTKILTSDYIKSNLETIALEFKRAAAILRLQALDCEKPCEDDLGMSPLFGEVMLLIVQAADFTERCDELCVWDARDNWYHACVFFRDAVVQDERVWGALCRYYGQGKYKPLKKAWEQGSVEWLLLDADYPDVEI